MHHGWQRESVKLRNFFGARTRAEPGIAAVADPPLLQSYLAAEPWTIDGFRVDRGETATRVEVDGWAFPDPDLGAASQGKFSINGQPFTHVQYPIDREDIGKYFWMRRNSRYSGFHCVADLPNENVYPGGVMQLTYAAPGPAPRVAAQQSFFYYDREREGAIPEPERRFRVLGNYDEAGFLRSGFTDFRRLDAAAESLSGADFAHHPRILDWGCGCGRLARYAAQIPGIELSGCDIDADNVNWCATNLKGHFAPSGMRPPLPFPSAGFDLIYGLSIFTHLREPLQDEWLAELQRVCAPGGLLLMTVHGRTALDYAGVQPGVHADLQRRIKSRGIYESGSNNQIDGYAENADEYVNVYHDADYIRSHWGRVFEILTILPGYIYTHDLVVMRKRTSA